jgi:DNA-binding transcriptional MerR regulator
MFNNDDILILAKAGFNAQQIAALNAIGSQVQMQQPQQQMQMQQPQQQMQQPQQQMQQPQQPQQMQQPQQQGATINDVLNSLDGLTKTFQNGFLLNSQQPKQVTAEDILAEIINPPTPTQEGGKS